MPLIPVLSSEENESGSPPVEPEMTYASNYRGSAVRSGRSRLSPRSTRTLVASTIQFDVTAVAIAAGGTASFGLVRSGNVSFGGGVTISITGGSASAADYGSLSTTLITWAPGESGLRTFSLPTVGDDDLVDETVVISITAVGGAVVGPNGTATLTILGKSSLSWASSTASVPAGQPANLSVARTGAVGLPVSATVSAIAGTAGAADYGTPNPATVSWAANDIDPKPVTISTVNDADASNESFILRLSSPSNAVIGTADATITITPAYHPDTQSYIDRLNAEGLSRTTSALDLIDAAIKGMVTDGDWGIVADLATYQLTGSNALAIASHKIKGYTGQPKVTFVNATNASFSRNLGFTSAGGAGSAYFRTGVPQNLGIATTAASRNKALGILPTALATANFAAFLSAGNGSSFPLTLRVADPAASVLSFEFNGGSIQATGQSGGNTYLNKVIWGAIESAGAARLYNGSGTAVGTTATVATSTISAAEIFGHVYADASNNIVATPFALSSALHIIVNAGATSAQIGRITGRLNTLYTGLAAL